MMLRAADAALFARIDERPSAGDEVCFGTGRRYAIGVVYSEARDGRPYLLLRVNEGATAGVLHWFEVVGRCGPEELRVVARGRFADRVPYWKARYPW